MKYVSVLFLSLLISSRLLSTATDSLLTVYFQTHDPQEKHSICLALTEKYLQKHQVDSALLFAKESIQLAEAEGRDSRLAQSYFYLAQSLLRNNQFAESDSILDYALRYVPAEDRDLKVQIYLKKFENDLRRGISVQGASDLAAARQVIGADSLGITMARYCAHYGIYLIFQTQLLDALKWLLRARELGGTNDFELMQYINHNLATIYVEIGAYDKALQVARENERLARKEKVPFRELFSLFTIATAYGAKEEYDSTKMACRRAIYLKDSTQITTSLGYIYFQLGLAYLAEHAVDSAIHSFQDGIRLSEQQNERKEAGECHYGMSLAYLEQSKLEQAAFHAAKAQELLSYYIDDLSYHHAEIYARQQNFKKAYAILNQGFLQQQAIDQPPISYQIIETLLTNKFEEEKQKADYQYKRQLNRQVVVGAILFVSLAFVTLLLILYYQAQSKQKLTQLNTELHTKNQDLTHFAYITSHDLKEPIRNINSFAGLIDASLKRQEVDIQRFQEYLGFIQASSKTSYQIIDSLRTYTSLSNDELKFQRVSVVETWKAVKSDVQDLLNEKNGEIYLLNLDQIDHVYFPAAMLRLILRNLIRNGLVYNEAQMPLVEVSLEESEGEIVFKVSDNGTGIDSLYHQQIFQPFKTLANKSLTQSSGLGLAICKNILEKTGNRIWLESEKGKGSRFYFSLSKEN